MKKGLSVLLIAAALFGFYGGAVNVQDVLAAKDYWEKKSEQTTADLNKLEDGLKTLDENKETYLDGLDKIAEGEQTLAEGEANYEAAPAKLADARKKIAAGEAKLAKGYKDLAKGKKDLKEAMASRAALRNVRKKIEDVEKAYAPWLNNFNRLTKSIVDNPANPSKGVLYDAGATAVGLGSINAAFDTVEQTGTDGKAAVEGKAKAGVRDRLAKEITDNPGATYDGLSDDQKSQVDAQITDDTIQGAIEANADLSAAYAKANGAIALAGYLKGKYSDKLLAKKETIEEAIGNIKTAEYQATALRKSSLNSDTSDAAELMDTILNDPMVSNNKDTLGALIAGLNQVKGLAGNAKDSTSEYNSNYDDLKPNATMGSKIGKAVAAAAKAILSNTDIAAKLTGAQKEALKPFMSSSSITGLPNVELLYGTMTLGQDKKDDGQNSLLDSFRTISGAAANGVGLYNEGISDGEDKLEAGKAKLAKGERDLADGKALYAQGLKDYEEAPQKLADGRKELAAGKEKLAEYEDGEQQVRDGLATLMESQRYADLETILERRNGDDNFDAADKSLDIPDGLNAVGTGREYQSATGEIITAELGGRILGSGLELGAAAIAVLAAVLSLLKKFKGAAVSAVAAAAMGVSGIIAANNAGMEMSTIAGSNMGATPMVAAGILAAVAAVFSVVHFTAKKEV